MKTIKFIIEPMGPEDWEAVREIYLEGIATGHPTIETEAPPWERWNNSHRPDCRLVARDGEQVVGWAALSPVPSRPVYSGVAEMSVYVAAHFRRRRAGRLLLDHWSVPPSRPAYGPFRPVYWSKMRPASASIPPVASARLAPESASAACYWRDTVLMERRSEAAGV